MLENCCTLHNKCYGAFDWLSISYRAPKDDEVTKDPQNEDHLSTLDPTEDSVVENGAENMLVKFKAQIA